MPIFFKEAKFESCNSVKDLQGRHTVHENNWKVQMQVISSEWGEIESGGQVEIDSAAIGEAFLPVIKLLDHKVLKDFILEVTPEKIATFIFTRVSDRLKQKSATFGDVCWIEFIRVWENETDFTELRGGMECLPL